jgi:hypothetical protein
MRIGFGETLGLVLFIAASACSTSSSGDTGDGGDVAVIPFSCGATEDCVSVGLDADMCVYSATVGGCAATGHCMNVTIPPLSASCAPERAVCPCSGGTQLIPPCWPKDLSPIAISTLGECPVDGGKSP